MVAGNPAVFEYYFFAGAALLYGSDNHKGGEENGDKPIEKYHAYGEDKKPQGYFFYEANYFLTNVFQQV